MVHEADIKVGNIFYFPFHKENVIILGYAKIEADDSFKVQFETRGGILLEPLRVLQPIPLSSDILDGLKLGKKDGYSYQMLMGFIKIKNGKYFFKYFDIEIELETVHHLQNVYYYLSGGKELIITL